MFRAIFLFARECVFVYRFFARTSRKARQVVFYSEGTAYFKYFEGFIKSILDLSDLEVCYITSDEHDPVFDRQVNRVQIFYFKRLLPFVMLFVDSKVLVMTMTDLHRFHIRKSIRGGHYVYVFHAMVSTHMIYQDGAFDHYDTIFCTGPHQMEEIRRREELYYLRPKQLIEVGYPWLEKLYDDHQGYLHESSPRCSTRQVLVAPSWAAANILETCIVPIVMCLSRAGYGVVIRPHPEWIKRHPKRLEALREELRSQELVEWELDALSDQAFHRADVLVTDWSGIALEYAFATEKPVLFVDVPRKVYNPEYERLGLVPLEVQIRDRIGKVVHLNDIHRIDDEVSRLMENQSAYRDRIVQERVYYVYNFGKASRVGAEFIVDLCREA